MFLHGVEIVEFFISKSSEIGAKMRSKTYPKSRSQNGIKKNGKKSRGCLKSGQFGRSWLTPGSPIGSDFGCPKGEKCIKKATWKNETFGPLQKREKHGFCLDPLSVGDVFAKC